MVVSIVATVRAKPGHEAQFEALARQLVSAVNTNEPGCLLFTLNRGDDPHAFVFMERYGGEQAAQAHLGTEYSRRLGREMKPHMDGPVQVIRMVEIAGPGG